MEILVGGRVHVKGWYTLAIDKCMIIASEERHGLRCYADRRLSALTMTQNAFRNPWELTL